MKVIVVANGTLPRAEIKPEGNTPIVAADGGGRHCLQLGIVPQVLIGDFDSLSDDEIRELEAAGSTLYRYPTDKDETDLELALDYALECGADEITLYGLLGGRWDMSFANILLLAAPRYSGVQFQVMAADTRLYILRAGETLKLTGHPGDTVSVIPFTPDVGGLSYTGLAWPLENASLAFGSPRGVSNRLVVDTAQIKLENGVALVVHISGSPNSPA